MQKQLQEFMNTQMTRKEFLKRIGAILLALFGVSNLLAYLAKDHYNAPASTPRSYGRNSFGGKGIKPHKSS